MMSTRLHKGTPECAWNSISTPEKSLSIECRSTILTPPTAVELQEDKLLKKTGVLHDPNPGELRFTGQVCHCPRDCLKKGLVTMAPQCGAIFTREA